MRLRFDRQSWYRARSFSAEARSCCGCPKIDPVRKDQWQRLMGGGQEDASACQMNLHKAAEQLERSGIKPIGRLVQQPAGRFGRNDPRQHRSIALPGGPPAYRHPAKMTELQRRKRLAYYLPS